jgi:hypothetical protein
MELFRREALDGQDRLHGDIVFVPQISWRLLAAFFAASLAAAALFLRTADYRPATPVSGRLADGGDGTLTALFEVPAQAAEAVAPGRPLLLSVPGSQPPIEALVAAVTPSGDGRATVRAVLPAPAADAPFPPAGTTVRAPLPAHSRSLGAWLFGSLSGRDGE